MRILRLLQAQSGQGLFELVAVLGVFLAAIAVGVPGYLGFQDRKADKQARANLLAAVQLAEVYRTSHGSYLGMDAWTCGGSTRACRRPWLSRPRGAGRTASWTPYTAGPGASPARTGEAPSSAQALPAPSPGCYTGTPTTQPET